MISATHIFAKMKTAMTVFGLISYVYELTLDAIRLWIRIKICQTSMLCLHRCTVRVGDVRVRRCVLQLVNAKEMSTKLMSDFQRIQTLAACSLAEWLLAKQSGYNEKQRNRWNLTQSAENELLVFLRWKLTPVSKLSTIRNPANLPHTEKKQIS